MLVFRGWLVCCCSWVVFIFFSLLFGFFGCCCFGFELYISLAYEVRSCIKSLENYTKSKTQIERQGNTVGRIIGKSFMSFFLICVGQIKRVQPKATWWEIQKCQSLRNIWLQRFWISVNNFLFVWASVGINNTWRYTSKPE